MTTLGQRRNRRWWAHGATTGRVSCWWESGCRHCGWAGGHAEDCPVLVAELYDDMAALDAAGKGE